MKSSYYLFGSYARGDYDAQSDLDVLLIKKNKEIIDDSIKKELSEKYKKSPSFSIYTQDRLSDYYRKGNLFAWHLFLESKIIKLGDCGDILYRLGAPAKYCNFEKDLQDFYKLLMDIKNNILLGTRSIIFEAGNLYTVMRNMFFLYVFMQKNVFNFSPYYIYNCGCDYRVPIAIKKYKKYKEAKTLRSYGKLRKTYFDIKEIIDDVEIIDIWAREVFDGYLFRKDTV
ncbi:nucleotidyltransferase domain-containing protein [Marispirochaeta aestuarii]|uniref:nucleotidyltransferase domain-containing protein n=1 Tax=Marispirochaeta aestuarii TaxID=1963862 RepID=UPI0029C60F07|nr:nucleotidyltransferase domain-containing protein [Marispirochaeta aestuarii]